MSSGHHRLVFGNPISFTYAVKHEILTLFFLVLILPAIPHAGAQSSPNNNNNNNDDRRDDAYPYSNQFTPSIAIIVVVLVAALFLMGFISIYIRRRNIELNSENNIAAAIGGGVGRSRRPRGLDRAVIDSFPTFVYSSVKGIKIGKGALECAVCLNEFEEDDTIRLIPKCDHVFHPECIDAWLENHTTCPVCRAQLAPQSDESVHAVGSMTGSTATAADIEAQNEDASTEQGVEQRDERDRQHEVVLETEPEVLEYLRAKLNRNRRSKSTRRLLNRSHSTGHLLIKPGDCLERFTLKLPVEARKQIMNRKLHRATSLVVLPREACKTLSYRHCNGIYKGYSRSSSKRPEGSNRWIAPFFTRMLSRKVAASDGEGTSAQPVLAGVPRSDSVQPPV